MINAIWTHWTWSLDKNAQEKYAVSRQANEFSE